MRIFASLITTAMLLAPNVALADWTIIHAGTLLAVPGEDAGPAACHQDGARGFRSRLLDPLREMRRLLDSVERSR